MLRRSSLVVTFMIVAAFPAATLAQNVVWGLVVPPQSPAGRYQHAMAFDTARQRAVVYGGYNNSAGLSDTWEWDGATWAQRALVSAPAIRRGHAMAYDAARQRVVLWGGQDGGGAYPTAVWEWDGTTWTQQNPASGPAGRWLHTMAYDSARQRLVVFGGGIPGVPGNPFANDTWEWDGTAWLQMAPPTSPPGRRSPCMAYDAARQSVVLFGGQTTASAFASDTWEWNGVDWAQRTAATTPTFRSGHAMAFDSGRQTVVMFGGYNTSAGYLRDTWEWNGTDWLQSTPTTRPTARMQHTMVFDAARQTVLLFGGQASTGAAGDTWLTYLPAVATAYGTGCGSPVPLGFVPDPTARPKVGQTARATVTDAPTPLVGVAMGWSNQWFGASPLPLPLGFLGMPGCVLLQSTDILGLGTTPVSATTFSYQLLLPNQPNLMGHRAYIQAYALAPGQNALEVIASNGIEWLFGNV